MSAILAECHAQGTNPPNDRSRAGVARRRRRLSLAIGSDFACLRSDAHPRHDRNILPSARSPFESLRVSGLEPSDKPSRCSVHQCATHGNFLCAASVSVNERDSRWVVDATTEGEAIDPSRDWLSGDTKAVTLHRLNAQRADNTWDATVLPDL